MARKPVVIVTGASKGLGLAITTILLKDLDAVVVALSRTKSPELQELSNSYSSTLLFVECNVADSASIARAVSVTETTYGNIDGVILNAGVLDPIGKINSPDIPLEAWKEHFDVNFFSLVTTLRATLPALHKSEFGGKVIFVSSGAAVGGTPGWGPYNASKAAVNSLCRTLAQEEPDIVAVAVRPGMVDTAMQSRIREAGASRMAEADYHKFVNVHAQGKLVKPEDAGHVIASLGLNAPKSLSGQFVSWDSDELKAFRRQK